MSYIAFDASSNSFYLTNEKGKGVTMQGKPLEYDQDDEALDFIDDLNNSFGEDPPIGIDVHYSASSNCYDVSIKTDSTTA